MQFASLGIKFGFDLLTNKGESVILTDEQANAPRRAGRLDHETQTV